MLKINGPLMITINQKTKANIGWPILLLGLLESVKHTDLRTISGLKNVLMKITKPAW